jgi:hypothetical protein
VAFSSSFASTNRVGHTQRGVFEFHREYWHSRTCSAWRFRVPSRVLAQSDILSVAFSSSVASTGTVLRTQRGEGIAALHTLINVSTPDNGSTLSSAMRRLIAFVSLFCYVVQLSAVPCEGEQNARRHQVEEPVT